MQVDASDLFSMPRYFIGREERLATPGEAGKQLARLRNEITTPDAIDTLVNAYMQDVPLIDASLRSRHLADHTPGVLGYTTKLRTLFDTVPAHRGLYEICRTPAERAAMHYAEAVLLWERVLPRAAHIPPHRARLVAMYTEHPMRRGHGKRTPDGQASIRERLASEIETYRHMQEREDLTPQLRVEIGKTLPMLIARKGFLDALLIGGTHGHEASPAAAPPYTG